MCAQSFESRRRFRSLDIPVALGVVALLSLMLVGMPPRVARARDGSLAGENSEVVSQGVATLSGDRLAWRVVQDSAEPAGTGDFQQRPLGFAIATDGTFLQTEQSTGARMLIHPDEAAFAPDGDYQSRESLDTNPVSYLRIGLVAEADASNADGDTLVYGGDGFDVVAGDYDIELIGIKLEPNEAGSVDATGTSLVLVTEGSVTLGDETLNAGEAISVDGAVQLQAQNDGARAYVATIGDSVAAVAAPPVEQQPTAEAPATEPPADTSASIVVSTELCPPGTTVKQVHASQLDPCAGGGAVTDMTISVTNTDTGVEQDLGVDPSSGEALFQGLAPGNYTVLFSTTGAEDVTLATCGGQDNSADLPVVMSFLGSVDLSLPSERQYFCTTQTLTSDVVADTSGSLNVTFFACPDGMTYDTLDTSQCSQIVDGFDFGIQGDGPDLPLSDASWDNGTFTWAGLTTSADPNSGVAYSPIVYTEPDGYDAYGISTDGGDVLLPHAGGYILTADEPSFDLAVYFFAS